MTTLMREMRAGFANMREMKTQLETSNSRMINLEEKFNNLEQKNSEAEKNSQNEFNNLRKEIAETKTSIEANGTDKVIDLLKPKITKI